MNKKKLKLVLQIVTLLPALIKGIKVVVDEIKALQGALK